MDKALTEAAANYSAFVQDLKLKLEKEIRVWNSLLSLHWKYDGIIFLTFKNVSLC